ncbi:MAG: hypothetical protein SOI64_07560 [Bifidobacterium mongoliense]|jgi:hypothetical protein|uniref:hypothetical protein n=1 Tax=Bifidobacterium mongoliense TaxID=518643 RepID=UPI002F354588
MMTDLDTATDVRDDIDPLRGQFMGDGIPRSAGGQLLDPLEGTPDPDDAFWKSSDALEEIRMYARSRGIRVNPWALLSAVLARVSVALPPNIVADPLRNGQPIPLQLFIALLGPSGAGKGITERAAANLVPDIRSASTHIPASGEGIPTMFAVRERTDDGGTRLKPLTPRALLSVPEITHLGGAARRIGSTLISTLLSAFQGEPIGAANRNEADRYEIPRNGYRLCLITGVQPANAGVLLDETASGLPQRFLWFDVRDPEMPVNAMETDRVADMLTCFPYDSSRLPTDPDSAVLRSYYNPLSDGICKPSDYPRSYRYVTYPDVVAGEFDLQRIRVNHGAVTDPLDAHRLMVTARVAALLAVLERPGAFPNVTEAEWRNATTILERSGSYRSECIRDMKRARSSLRADELEISETAKSEVQSRGVETAKDKILDWMSSQPRLRTGVKGRTITQHITRACRQYVSPALAELHTDGYISLCGDDTGYESRNMWRLT